MPAEPSIALRNRLALITGRDAEEAYVQLQEAARAAEEAPAFDLMWDLCRTLSDRNRLKIAAVLKREGQLSAAEVEAALGLSQATISHHMKALTDTGIIRAERAGRWIYYRLDERFERLVP